MRRPVQCSPRRWSPEMLEADRPLSCFEAFYSSALLRAVRCYDACLLPVVVRAVGTRWGWDAVEEFAAEVFPCQAPLDRSPDWVVQ